MRGSNYSSIFKSSSIYGGVQVVNYVFVLVRTKFIAILLGPSGVGLLGIYTQIIAVASSLASMGISQSGVREISGAANVGDEALLRRRIDLVLKACILSAFLGLLVVAVFSKPLSYWVFGGRDSQLVWNGAMAILSLAPVVAITVVSNGQGAVIQGLRRMGDVARQGVISVGMTTVFSIAAFCLLREKAIIPSFYISSLVGLVTAWYYVRKAGYRVVGVNLHGISQAKGMIFVGLAFCWNGVSGMLVQLAIRSEIIRGHGIEANGIFQSAWALSGMFSGFIISAMATDFLPRLTEVCDNSSEANRYINEQTEMGMLMVLPGLVGTISLAPFVLQLLYSSKFLAAATLLPWLGLGVFGQMICWPIGWISGAKGLKRWIITIETVSNIIRLLLSVAAIRWFGIKGLAISVPILNFFVFLPMTFWMGHRLTGFRWSKQVLRLFGNSCAVVGLVFALSFIPWGWGAKLGCGMILTMASSVYAFRGVALRVGEDHRLVQLIKKTPLRFLIPRV
jgi:PST family polysaccharide transporter